MEILKLHSLCFVLHRILLVGCNFWGLNNEGSPCPPTPATITPTRACMHASLHPCCVACCEGGANYNTKMDAAAAAVKIAISAGWALVADRRYFIPVVTDILIKHQEQRAVPASPGLSLSYTHTLVHLSL